MRLNSGPKLGKRILDDLYIHKNYLEQVLLDDSSRELVHSALAAMSEADLKLCNVVKINVTRKRLSFLQYLSFDEDPFPTLNGSWIFDYAKKIFTLRSYSTSLNPPILHRKELLVGEDHPERLKWIEITKYANDLGLFSSDRSIGFKLNWQKLIAEKGFCVEGHQFLPIGNQEKAFGIDEFAEGNPIQRHLTALSRSSISAPIQLLISHGLVNSFTDIFDYGCGRGDDLRALTDMGLTCQGWDPHYARETSKIKADIVNLGFVLNVIEDPAERLEALKNSFILAKVVLVVSVMLHSKDRPGKPYRDGFLTSRNTFQKYFSQSEFKEYLESVLEKDPILVGPGIALVFADCEAEQRYLLGRYRSSNFTQRLMRARLGPRVLNIKKKDKVKIPKIGKADKEFLELKTILEQLWFQTLDLGRFPEAFEIINLNELLSKISLTRARRLLKIYFDQELLSKAEKTRSDEIKLFFAARQFGKKSTYKDLEPRLKNDVKYFFGDYKMANEAALSLLLDSANPDKIRLACEEAASEGLGWLETNSHSLQLHRSLIERLPSVLRAYVNCGLILWSNISDFQLIKIHIASGKLTLLQYSDFDTSAIPVLTKRIKVNIPMLDYDVFEYEEPQFPPLPLFFKSRYMHEDLAGFAEQSEFDEKLESTGIIEDFDQAPTYIQLQEKLISKRLEISGLILRKSTSIPSLNQKCGQYLTFKELIHCGETQSKLGISNLPLNPDTYNALYNLATKILDPVIEYYGSIKISYGFCSPELAQNINSRIAPKLDQHSSHERNKKGFFICDRLGAAVDFLVEDENMLDVAQWIVDNLSFDRIYIYGSSKPIHISYSESPSNQISLMIASNSGRLIPRNTNSKEFNTLISNLSNF
jgi:DNA phosphorothioation-associated putative methyltransferase